MLKRISEIGETALITRAPLAYFYLKKKKNWTNRYNEMDFNTHFYKTKGEFKNK